MRASRKLVFYDLTDYISSLLTLVLWFIEVRCICSFAGIQVQQNANNSQVWKFTDHAMQNLNLVKNDH